jgi:hypothetical protein
MRLRLKKAKEDPYIYRFCYIFHFVGSMIIIIRYGNKGGKINTYLIRKEICFIAQKVNFQY